jgi:transposase InsO family protein
VEVLKVPWKEIDAMSLKKEFVLKSLQEGICFVDLCREYSISTKCGYTWKKRFIEEGFKGLEERSRTPVRNGKATPEHIVLEIISLKVKKEYWGPKKILEIYARAHPEETLPVISTVERILKKAGLVEARKRKRFQTVNRIKNRVEPTKPNEVWTVDFKGWWYTPHKEKCEPLTVRDGFSKFILSIKILGKGDIPSVKREFERLFTLYGLPESIRSDNGPPFASAFNYLGLTKLAVWWMALGIKLDRIEPGSPYQNGSHERMHLDMKRELEEKIDGDLLYHQKVFDEWREEYNRERPHEALGMKTPASVYTRSTRVYDPKLDGIDYPIGFRSRTVNDRGYISFRNERYFIGNPFAGYNVGVKIRRDGNHEVWFDDIFLGIMDSKSCLIVHQENTKKKVVS